MKAITIKETGDIKQLTVDNIGIPEPSDNEVLVKIHYAGVNFIDIYQRMGKYPGPMPQTIGSEASGIVEKVGKNVTRFSPGDRVVYAMVFGAYAEYAVIPEEKLIVLPENISFELGAAIMLQGLTVEYLTSDCFNVEKDMNVFIHAAAGGVGLLLTQIVKAKGAQVIGTTSSEDKAELAYKAGADHIILYTKDDFVENTKNYIGENQMHVVYDSVGKTTLNKSLSLLRQRGSLISFGQSSGSPPSINPLELQKQGSIYLTRPTLASYIQNADELEKRTDTLFQWINDGTLNIRIDRQLDLDDAHEAHRLLESRSTAGKILLRVN
ncbi:MAG: NADPH:quinone reductase [Dehalococcoidaceae bacterium]|nr:NADPH:quinone reductase [Dehalococcoidaceae bacterium]